MASMGNIAYEFKWILWIGSERAALAPRTEAFGLAKEFYGVFSCGSLKFIMLCTYPRLQVFLGECGSLPSQVKKNSSLDPNSSPFPDTSIRQTHIMAWRRLAAVPRACVKAVCAKYNANWPVSWSFGVEFLERMFVCKLTAHWNLCAFRWAHLKPEALPAVSVCTVVNMKPAACSSRDKAWLYRGKSPKGFPNWGICFQCKWF